MMRVMLYEAAQILLTRTNKWSWLKAWAMQIARRRGMKKAIVALARRLTARLYCAIKMKNVFGFISLLSMAKPPAILDRDFLFGDDFNSSR